MAHPDTYLDKIINGTKQDLDSFLAFFLWECPSSMIPTKKEVLRWAEALDKRGPEFAPDAAACREFASGNGDLIQARVVYDPARDLLVATVFATGAALEAQDPREMAELLFAAGVRHGFVSMPDWREGDIAPTTGDKIALNHRLNQLGRGEVFDCLDGPDRVAMDLSDPAVAEQARQAWAKRVALYPELAQHENESAHQTGSPEPAPAPTGRADDS